jgi:hypothetical protein
MWTEEANAVTDETPNLILEHLRALRDGQRTLGSDIRELKDSQTAIRHMLAAMQSDALRQEAALAALRVDVDTIKRRLNLVEA